MIHIQLQNKKQKKFLIFIITLLFTTCFYLLASSKYYKTIDRKGQLEKFTSTDNQKAIGWIRVQGTSIDMPIVNYYTNDVENPTYNIGWRVDDSKKQDEKMIIYSHNMKNVSSHPLINDSSHKRFEPLMGFIYKSFLDKNKYIQYTIGNKNYLYKIYGVSFQKKDKFDNYEGDVSKEYKDDYIKKVKKNSYFSMKTDVNGNDKLITLVTCTRFFGYNNGYYFVVDARKVRKNEKIKNYKVYEKSNYKKIKKILKGDDKDE